jgi:hypothetical protein
LISSASLRATGSPYITIWAAAVLAVLPTAPAPVLADMQVRGSPEAVRIEAQNSSVEEILTALSHAFDIRYRSSASLDTRRSGTYAGSLPQVVTRVLAGYNFVLMTEDGNMVVTVFGTPTAAAAPAISGAVRDQAEAAPAAQPPGAAPDAAHPLAAPVPVIDPAEKPALPMPALPESGPAPAPIPEPGHSSAMPAPAAPAPGSPAIPAPRPGPGTSVPHPFGAGPATQPAGANE